MPRNSSGTYALPAGNPVVTNTLIQSTWANTTLSDVSTAMTDSLDRNGRGAMLAPLKNVDGTAVAPSMSFSSEGTLGIYRVSAGVLGFSAGGALVLSIAAAGLTFTNPIILPIGSATAPSLTFVANTNTGVYSPTTNQVGVTTNGAQRLLIDATGNVTVATGTLTFTAGQQVTFAATGANLITASHAAGTLALQTGGANTRLSIDAAGVVTVAQTTVLTGAVGIGGANALGKLQVFGGAVVIDNAQGFAAKSSGGAATNLALLDASNNLIQGGGAAIATQQFATGGTVRITIDAGGALVFQNSTGTIAHNSTTGNLTIVANPTLVDSTARIELYDTAHATEAKHIWYRADQHGWTKAAASTQLMLLDSTGNLSVSGTSGSGGASSINLTNGQSSSGISLNVTGTGFSAGGVGGSTAIVGPASSNTPLAIGNLSAGTGFVQVVLNGAERMRITSAGVIQDGAGNELGYKGLPQNSQGVGYTLVASDRGKHVYITAAVNVTVPAGVFSTGDVITIVNASNTNVSITIVQGASASLFQTGSTNTGNRTLLVHGFATLLCTQGSSSSFFVSGNIT